MSYHMEAFEGILSLTGSILNCKNTIFRKLSIGLLLQYEAS